MKKINSIIILALALSVCFAPRSAAERYVADFKRLSLTEDDVSFISRAVRAETRGENYLIKACVAAMIFNRISSDPRHSVKDAVFGEGTFPGGDRESVGEYVPKEELLEYTVLAKLIYEYGIDPTCGATVCLGEEDEIPDGYDVTISVEGRRFARARGS